MQAAALEVGDGGRVAERQARRAARGERLGDVGLPVDRVVERREGVGAARGRDLEREGRRRRPIRRCSGVRPTTSAGSFRYRARGIRLPSSWGIAW